MPISSEFKNMLAQLIPPDDLHTSNSGNKKQTESQKRLVSRQNLLIDLEKEIVGWLRNVSKTVATESVKSFAPIIYSARKGLGLSQVIAENEQDGEISRVSLLLANRVSHEILEQLFFHTNIPSLLASQSRKHKTTVASKAKRPSAKAVYKMKIENLLKNHLDMDCRRLLEKLESEDWIIRSDNGNWMVAAAEADGHPDNSTPFYEVQNSTMEESVSTIRNKLRKSK